MSFRSLLLLVLTALALPAMAQVMARPAPGANLLLRKIVQDDLKLSADAREKIEAAYDKHMKAAGGERGPDGSVRFMGSPDAMQTAAAKFEKEAMAFLNGGQKTRLGELKIQAGGGRALLEPDLQKKLNVTKEQDSKMRAIDAKRNAAIQELAQNAGGRFDADFIAKIRGLSEKYDNEIEAVLTKTQSDAFEKMKGKPLPGLRSGPRIVSRGG